MAPPRSPFYSVDEYLAMERGSETRHEYIDSHIYDMAAELSGSVEIASITCRLEVREVYDHVGLPEVPPPAPDER